MMIENATVLEHRPTQGGYRLLTLAAPRVAPEVCPGQFVHVRVPHAAEKTLRRPFSVFMARDERLSILYKEVGGGTKAMAALAAGDTVNLLGPLGNGFPEPDPTRPTWLVAGGYGAAALYLLAERAPHPGELFIGGRTATDILCVPEFEALGWRVTVATEDGSRGVAGRVTQPLDARLAEQPDRVPELFACGPNAMLRAVADRKRPGGKAWLSMDRHMGCGVGACLTCVQRIRMPDGDTYWARVCKEGPVFEADVVVWEDTP